MSPLRALLGALLLLAVLAAPARAQDGVQTLTYEYGPVRIAPGQNTIEIEENQLKPPADGWITRFKPDLVYASDGTVPGVDVVHLHHGVWLTEDPATALGFSPLFAAGEEKTVIAAPPGFGWRYDAGDRWLMNHMIHNLTPTEAEVYITYELDFVPAGTPACTRSRRRGSTRSAAPTRCSTPGAAGTAATAGSPSRTRRPRPRGPTPGWCRRTARWSAPPGTCIPAGCTPT
jgi:hypothetical protein